MKSRRPPAFGGPSVAVVERGLRPRCRAPLVVGQRAERVLGASSRSTTLVRPGVVDGGSEVAVRTWGAASNPTLRYRGAWSSRRDRRLQREDRLCWMAKW